MIYHLQSRYAFRVHGPDAAEFLQNTLTNDIRKITAQTPAQYNLLLSPQGQVLHEMFVVLQGNGDYLIDTYEPRQADLLRRLTLFKLRANVTITPHPAIQVYAVPAGEAAPQDAIADPRTPKLGKRIYSADGAPAGLIHPEAGYIDDCIDMTVPVAGAIRFEKDFVHDLGLQNFNAIAWDKGCFIGQEVAARVEHRGLAKKGLFTVTAQRIDMANPSIALQNGMEAGEIRLSDRSGTRALAVIKKIAVEAGEPLLHAGFPLSIA